LCVQEEIVEVVLWHSGSAIGMLLHSLRGVYLLVPRNMTKAAGMYHAGLGRYSSDDRKLEWLPIKVKIPTNITYYKEPTGVPEVLIK